MEIKDYLFKNKYDFQFVDLQSNKNVYQQVAVCLLHWKAGN